MNVNMNVNMNMNMDMVMVMVRDRDNYPNEELGCNSAKFLITCSVHYIAIIIAGH
jgi:hypothetical protein